MSTTRELERSAERSRPRGLQGTFLFLQHPGPGSPKVLPGHRRQCRQTGGLGVSHPAPTPSSNVPNPGAGEGGKGRVSFAPAARRTPAPGRWAWMRRLPAFPPARPRRAGAPGWTRPSRAGSVHFPKGSWLGVQAPGAHTHPGGVCPGIWGGPSYTGSG